MAKSTRWIVEFKDRTETPYQVNIFDEVGSWFGMVSLIAAGDNPLVIDEDDSNDPFCPVRSKTGVLRVCNVTEDGTRLNVDDLLPANNTTHPVTVIRNPDVPGLETIVFQGFLSCDSFNQSYNGVPDIIELNLISVLEALDSVHVEPERYQGIKKIRNIISDIFTQVSEIAEYVSIYRVFYSATSWEILNKMIDTSSLFEVKENTNENKTENYISGLSGKEILSRICTYMGCTIRESECDVYMTRYYEQYGMYSQELTYFGSESDARFINNRQFVNLESINMLTQQWTGIDHEHSTNQGARSVEVSVRLDDYDIDVDIPQEMSPYYINQSVFPIVVKRAYDEEPEETATAYVSFDTEFNNRFIFKVQHLDEGDYERPIIREEGTVSDVFRSSVLYGSNDYSYIGSMMSEITNDDGYKYNGMFVHGTDADSYKALFSSTNYILKSRSFITLNVASGKLRINFDGSTIRKESDKVYMDSMEVGDKIKVAIKWGNKWLHQNKTWSTSFALIEITKSDDGTEIPITEYNSGEVELYIYGTDCVVTRQEEGVPAPYTYHMTNYILKSFSVSYEYEEVIGNEKTDNHYFRVLDTYFRDEVSIECNYGSMMHNHMSPCIVMESPYVPVRKVTYHTSPSNSDVRVPERDLLNQMEIFYERARHTITLEVEPLDSLPIKTINGIDSKLYNIIAASVDYKMCASTITLVEK